MKAMIPLERVESRIFWVRGEKVIVDSDLAELYGVTTKRLNEQVKRNVNRFPRDFMFQMGVDELDVMRSQIATASRRNMRFPPYVFTEHGALMAANVLNSKRAVAASVQVVRAFVKLRQMLASNVELARKVETLEKKYDANFKVVFDAIKNLMMPPESHKGKIGFVASKPKK